MRPLELGATIGILGDGQLGRMLSQAASRLGFKVMTFGPDRQSPAAQVSMTSRIAAYSDQDALAARIDDYRAQLTAAVPDTVED